MKAEIKPIRNEKDYAFALKYLDSVLDAKEATPEADVRDVVTILIEKYEEEHYPIDMPDPVEAIKFRMEQAGLTQKHLIPYVGSRSKVSEVLSGKRKLTLKMIRALNRHFGVPADVLLREKPISLVDEFRDFEFEKFPIVEMKRNGAFRGRKITDVKDKSEECIRFLIEKIGGLKAVPDGFFRKTSSARLNAKIDPYALQGWSLHVLAKASDEEHVAPYIKENVNESFLRSLVGLSVLNEGPRLAKEFLSKNGIILEVVPHLKNTYIDGAAFITMDGQAIIGLTLRYDRIDNFWFTLIHEIAHIVSHLDTGSFIVDDMSLRGSQTDNDIEREADNFAQKALLPYHFDLDQKDFVSKEEVLVYAAANAVHPAIVAGRIQYTKNNYRLFSNMIGRGDVRQWFDIV